MQYIEHMYLRHPDVTRFREGGYGRFGEQRAAVHQGSMEPEVRQPLKTEMIRELQRLGGATPLRWEHAVFERCTGKNFWELDWSHEGTQAGALLWTESFDQLAAELVDEGLVRQAKDEKTGEGILVPVDDDPEIDWSTLVYPPSLGAGRRQ